MNILKRVFRPQIFTGWHMLGVLGLFFGTIISVNMVLAFSAGSTWTGLVVKNTYVESQKFNARSAEIKKQDALGWTSTATYADGMVTVDMRASNGKPLRNVSVFAKLGRPVYEADDRTLEFFAKDDLYFAPTQLGAGEWKITVQAADILDNKWIQSTRFVVKE